jgi:hypothetical protein
VEDDAESKRVNLKINCIIMYHIYFTMGGNLCTEMSIYIRNLVTGISIAS